MDTRKKNVSQVATMAFRMSHKYAHMHTHLAAKGYHRTKRAVKATDHSFAAQSWHCHFLLAVPTAAERETERERDSFQHSAKGAVKCSVNRTFYVLDTSLPAHSTVLEYNEASFIGTCRSYLFTFEILRFQS